MHDIGFFIWKYSHHFVVNATNQAGVLLAKQFSWRYVTYKLTKENGSYVRKVDKAWSARTNHPLSSGSTITYLTSSETYALLDRRLAPRHLMP